MGDHSETVGLESGMNDRKKQSKGPQDDDSLSWATAKKVAETYANVPATFSTAIRSLMKDCSREGGGVSDATRWQLRRLVRSDSTKAPLYFAARTFYPEKLTRVRDAVHLVDVFGCMELATILGVLYLFRRGRKVSDEKEWEFLITDLHAKVEVGALAGLSMPNIGFSLGLLSACMRPISLAAFMLNDLKVFTDYRRRLKVSGKAGDFEFEAKRWGCNHAQVASSLIISLGFSSDLADSVGRGYEMTELEHERNQRGAYAGRCAEIWTESLLRSGNPPNIVHSGNFYPLKEDLQRLLTEANRVRQSGSRYRWLDKHAADLTRESAPELFTSPAPAAKEEEDSTVSEIDELDE